MLEVNDLVTVCYQRTVMEKSSSQQSLGRVMDIVESTADVLMDLGGRQERVAIPVDSLSKGINACDTCVHGLRRMTTGMCPAKYKKRDQLENETDRTCEPAIFDVNDDRLPDVKECS